MHLSNAHPSLSCEASPYRYISRAVFVSFMFPEEGLITESARNVTFHLLLFLFSHSTTVCTRMASSKPLPQRTPQPRRSRRLRGQEPSPERVVGSAASSPFGGPVSPNGENPSPLFLLLKEVTVTRMWPTVFGRWAEDRTGAGYAGEMHGSGYM